MPPKIRAIAERYNPEILRFPEIRKTDEHVAEDRRLLGEAVLKASVLARSSDRFVIVRHKDSRGGEWNIPGGLVEIGESVEHAALRETKEEAGVDIELEGALAIIVSRITAPHQRSLDYFRVIFLARITGGQLEVLDRDEIAEAKLASWQEIAKLISQGKFQRIPVKLEKLVMTLLRNLP